MSGSRQLLVCLLLSALLGSLSACSPKNSSGVSFAFERPEHLEFACFAPLKAPRQKEYAVLPAHCCRVYDSTSVSVVPPSTVAPECARVGNDEVGTPALHALATQSTRGEVAAVDLVANRVLDSDRQVPGYTFLDTGGLPTAIVVPPALPRAVQTDPARNAISAGPAWTYVASAEQLQVRAIPTCRFRSGTSCGPDLRNVDPQNRPSNTSSYDERTRVQLPAAPADMKLGPGPGGADQALWVTLPDLGLIARIDLAEVPIERVDYVKADGTLGTADYANPTDAFELRDTATGRRPKDPVFFRVPAAPAATPLTPLSEAEYTAICGLGYEFRPAKRTLLLAPRVPPTAEVQPTELRFDADSGLLLVGDRVAPVIHAFAPGVDGTLTSLAALATGSPARTFVLTPPVPAVAVDLKLIPAPGANPSSGAATKRYLYASDADGRLMVFDFMSTGVGATPVLQPLLTPTPGTAYADRIETPLPVTALEVIDTRNESDYVCGQDLRTALVAQRDAKKAELAKVEARLGIYDLAAPDYLRGVFVVAAAASGAISVIDVHDLDVSCRARRECCVNDTCTGTTTTPGVTDNLTIARSPGNQEAVAIRRHAVRRRAAGGTQGSSTQDSLLRDDACRTTLAEPFQKLGAQRLCAPADPWTQLTQTWTVRYQQLLPTSQTRGAAIRLLDDAADTLEVLTPVEYQTCATGVEVGDLVAVVGLPDKALRSATCPDPTVDTAILLEITQAFSDRLVVKPAPAYLTRNMLSADQVQKQLLRCYPDLAGVELRSKSYLVTSSANIYLHRVKTAEDGSCVVDESKDPLLTSRLIDVVDAGVTRQVFKNPYVEFTLADPTVNTTLPESREVAVSVLQGSSGLQVSSVLATDSVGDALPATLRYVSSVGNLFVLDTAGQGLRRYTLRPFQNDGQSFR